MRRSLGTVAGTGALLGALLLPMRAALAWGPEGHRLIALIADRIMQQSAPAARAKVEALLAADKGSKTTKNDIASEAIWADVLREKSEEARSATSTWHAVRLKPDKPDVATACFGHKPLPEGYPASHGPRDNCSIDKIGQFAAELKEPDTTPGEKLMALQFTLNLVGDLHDPLLAIDEGDSGGECIALQIGTKPPVRLSTYWQDTLVQEVAGGDAGKGAAAILASVPAAEAQKLAGGNPEAWALETYEVAKAVTYSFKTEQPTGKYEFPAKKGQKESCATVDLYKAAPEYETRALTAVRTQLAKAGIRLAAVLRDNAK